MIIISLYTIIYKMYNLLFMFVWFINFKKHLMVDLDLLDVFLIYRDAKYKI